MLLLVALFGTCILFKRRQDEWKVDEPQQPVAPPDDSQTNTVSEFTEASHQVREACIFVVHKHFADVRPEKDEEQTS